MGMVKGCLCMYVKALKISCGDGQTRLAADGVLIVFGDSTMVVVHVLGYALQLQRLAWRYVALEIVVLLSMTIIVYH